jgi:quercetin dioxygenase-like cupin family protein
MNPSRIALRLLLLLPQLFAERTASAQVPAPPKGFDTTTLGVIDLGPEIDGMKGRVLRLSTTTVAPGSVMPAHPHKDRPEIIYVREGSLTEIRNGTAKEHGPGSVLIMTHDTVHGLENRSSAPVVYIAAPIAKLP